MKNKSIIISLFLGATILLNGCTNTSNIVNPQTPSSPENPQTQLSSENQYTLQEVAKHKSASDCWMIIEGKVYNVTSEIARHPGGDAILMGCGQEATQLFQTKGGDEGPHSRGAQSQLQQFYVGDVKN